VSHRTSFGMLTTRTGSPNTPVSSRHHLEALSTVFGSPKAPYVPVLGFRYCHPIRFPLPGYAHSRTRLILRFHRTPCGARQNAAVLLLSRDHRYSPVT
jgi:hypothetical protein